MKTNWFRRTLVGVAASAALAGSIAAYSQGEGFHRGPPTAENVAARDADMATHEARFLAHAGRALDLDAGQAAKLKVLADLVRTQRPGEPAPGAPPHQRAGLDNLISGSTFDRAGAQKLADAKIAEMNARTAQLQAASPAVIDAAGNFYDSLKPVQQEKLRAFVVHHPGFGHGFDRESRHGGWGRHGGDAEGPHGNDTPPAAPAGP